MNPIDYSSAFENVVSPYQSMVQGVQSGAAIQQMQMQQQQQQAQVAQAKQMQSDLSSLSQNPTPDAIGAMMLKYPTLAENLKRGADVLSGPQKQATLEHAGQVYAAVLNNKPDIAQKLLTDRAAALRNSGDEQGAAAAEQMAQQIADNPQGAALVTGMHLAAAMGPDKFTTAFKDLQGEQRDAAKAPAELASKTAEAEAKKLGVIGSTLGALQGKNAKPAQAIAALNSLAAKGMISKDDLQGYLSSVPTDPKQLDDWLGSMKLAGMKPDEQMKFTTPTADASLSAETQRRGQNIKHQEWVKEQEDANAPGQANEALAQRIAAYKQAPLGQFAMNKPWGQATMDRVAEINPAFDAATYPARAAAVKSFTNGTDGKQIESANIAMNHLATLKNLALAQKNGNVQLFNKLANQWAAATGGAAPTNLAAAAQMIGPEVVKTVSGVAGTGEERAHIEKVLNGNGNYSPDQVLGAVSTAQELFSGRLKEKKRSYERATKLNDFEDTFLSPAARELLTGKDGTASAKGASAAHPQDIDYLLNKYGNQ